jgi:glucose/arabinose dehydrogenase
VSSGTVGMTVGMEDGSLEQARVVNENEPMIALLLVVLDLSSRLLPAAAPEVVLEPVASRLPRPVVITHAGDSRLFIALQDGRIMIWDGTRVLDTPFLDIGNLVTDGGERGLLGLAFHPDYALNGAFFVNYTDLQGNSVTARLSVSGRNPDRAEASSLHPILTVPKPYQNHNGGQLQFGPDGYLYIGLGDGGSGGDPGNRAQNRGELLGKILRVDVDGSDYEVPPTNPFVGEPGSRAEIWAYGLRNPWRFSFDRATGDLWIADVGQGSWEEINFQPSTSNGGENYGWRRMEGTHCYNPASGCDDGTLTVPVIEYGHSGGACSVTGGYVYRGSRGTLPQGTYVFGDYCSGAIETASRSAGGRISRKRLLATDLSISTFGEDFTGEIYVADYSGGAIYRLAVESRKRRAVRH